MWNSQKKKIWIDLDNSPHVLFFKPIIEELNKQNYTVILTTRDCFQVCGLADLFELKYTRIGRHYGRIKIFKLLGLFIRSIQLTPLAMKEKPNIALSHGSRSQLLTASILGIPTVIMFDYEYTQKIPFFRPTWIIIPELIHNNDIKLNPEHIIRYPGIKEDVYVPRFEPDENIRDILKLNEEDLVVTIRPPATEAHYHNHQSEELFEEVINFLCSVPNIQMVLLPRNDKQTAFIRQKWPVLCANRKIVIPNHVVNGLNLIWHSDLVISGGGTMNRETAALGVPAYSIFRGKIGAVDQYLVNSGRLTLLENAEDIHKKILFTRRHRPARPAYDNRGTLKIILDGILKAVEAGQ